MELPLDYVSIFDGMVLLQKVSKHCYTFGEITDYFLMKMLSTTQKIVFVTEKNLESLTKALERKGRSVSATIRYKVKRREEKRPNQYAKFLRNPGNRMSLVKFLLNDWKFNIDGSQIFENNGTIQMDELCEISSDQEAIHFSLCKILCIAWHIIHLYSYS